MDISKFENTWIEMVLDTTRDFNNKMEKINCSIPKMHSSIWKNILCICSFQYLLLNTKKKHPCHIRSKTKWRNLMHYKIYMRLLHDLNTLQLNKLGCDLMQKYPPSFPCTVQRAMCIVYFFPQIQKIPYLPVNGTEMQLGAFERTICNFCYERTESWNVQCIYNGNQRMMIRNAEQL